jgi:hypothetical protein
VRSRTAATLVALTIGATATGGGAPAAGRGEAESGASRAVASDIVHVTVAPVSGARHSRLVVRITTRRATGVLGRTRRSYVADVHAAKPASGCVNNRDRAFADRPAGVRVRAVLDPARGEGADRGWCQGRFRGTITYSEGFACPPKGTCHPPRGFPARAQVVARFTVRVR